ncbi:hypothetical protein RQP46_005405 [Phenoliferia psychrophenolica]
MALTHAALRRRAGVYTLGTSLNTTVFATSNLASAPGVPLATPQLAVPAGEPAPAAAPPLHATRAATVTIRFPSKDAGGGAGISGLGMSMGSLRGGPASRAREASGGSFIPDPASPLLMSPGALPAIGLPELSAASNGTYEGSPSNGVLGLPVPGSAQTTYRPTLRRKPMSTAFSLPTLSSVSSDTVITSRPIRQFRGTSSSFVRSWEGLPLSQPQLRGLADANAGKDALFVFYTIGKGVVWAELSQGRPKDALCRVTFSTPPTCIDINQHTASANQLDVIVGFSNGDIFWFDPISAKYTRLNKSGVINSSPITSIQWLPPTPAYSSNQIENVANLFITSHADGSVCTWDKDREDWTGFAPTVPGPRAGHAGGKENEWNGNGNGGSSKTSSGEGSVVEEKHAPVGGQQPAGMGDITVSKPAQVDKKGQSMTKFNPISHWRVSKKAITAFAFSPGLDFVAVVGEDGCLRVIDTTSECLLDTYAGYFGALSCVAWSPDGRFVVTGGQDDLCTIYSPSEQRLVARCQGHTSFVTGVAWDPWKSDERTSRFASVGEDCKLILWDLSSAALSRPKAHGPHAHRRMSAGSTFSLARRRGVDSTSQLPMYPTERSGPVYHPAPIAMLQPLMVKCLSTDLFSSLSFLPDSLVTVSRIGQIKRWERPPNQDGELGLLQDFAASTVNLEARAR